MNPERGEIAVTLSTSQGAKRFTLRPTFRAIAQVESRLGHGIVPIAGRIAAKRFGVVDVAVILDETIAEAGRPTYEEIGGAVLQAGVMSFAEPLNDLLLKVLTGLDPEKRAGAPALPGEGPAPAAGPSGSPTGA